MGQVTEMNDGRRLMEFFAQKEQEGETLKQFDTRMLRAAQKKLRNPEVNKFYQIRCGRNEPCPCGSGKKFKKCCLDKCNEGEFEQAPKQGGQS